MQPTIDISTNTVPKNYSRGRTAFLCLVWLIVQSTIFDIFPRPFHGWRCLLLRLFGAKIGRSVKIRPGVRIEFPWRLTIGDYSAIGDNVWLYNLAPIIIGKHSVISQYAKLVTGSHDPHSCRFELLVKPIIIGNYAWIGANSFVFPGVTIEEGALLGACSAACKDIPSWTICAGNPATFIKKRDLAFAVI